MQEKQNNNFQLFVLYPITCIELINDKAHYLGYEEHPFDALMIFD
ncbi:MAG: hypothetical protein EBZ47_08170 [Chlamydiae bacterium]|nr:hypothetical protein [Chlamydiota bacterium]